MDHLFALILLAVGLFAATNVDDVFVLLGFYANPKFRPRQIALGQYLGIAALYGVSVVAGLIAIALAPAYVGLLGLIPIAMGLKQLWELFQGSDDDGEGDSESNDSSIVGGKVLAVSAVTFANGGDNISIYTPVFSTRSFLDVAIIGIVFLVMTAVWLLFAHWLVNHRTVGEPIRQYGPKVVPFAFIVLGALILYQGGTIALLFG